VEEYMAGGSDAKTSPEGEEADDTTNGEQETAAEGNTAEDTPLTLLQVNCRSIFFLGFLYRASSIDHK
jgi:hypothetical protein